MLNLNVLNALYDQFAINIMGTAKEGTQLNYFKATDQFKVAEINDGQDYLQQIIYMFNPYTVVFEIFSLKINKKDGDICLEFLYGDCDLCIDTLPKATKLALLKSFYNNYTYKAIEDLVGDLNHLD